MKYSRIDDQVAEKAQWSSRYRKQAGILQGIAGFLFCLCKAGKELQYFPYNDSLKTDHLVKVCDFHP